MRDYMDRRVTSPTWGPPPPCKQAPRPEFIRFFFHIYLFCAFICVIRHTKEKNVLSLTPTFKSLTLSCKSLGTIDKHLSANVIH